MERRHARRHAAFFLTWREGFVRSICRATLNKNAPEIWAWLFFVKHSMTFEAHATCGRMFSGVAMHGTVSSVSQLSTNNPVKCCNIKNWAIFRVAALVAQNRASAVPAADPRRSVRSNRTHRRAHPGSPHAKRASATRSTSSAGRSAKVAMAGRAASLFLPMTQVTRAAARAG
jgi:hypothetical protein